MAHELFEQRLDAAASVLDVLAFADHCDRVGGGGGGGGARVAAVHRHVDARVRLLADLPDGGALAPDQIGHEVERHLHGHLVVVLSLQTHMHMHMHMTMISVVLVHVYTRKSRLAVGRILSYDVYSRLPTPAATLSVSSTAVNALLSSIIESGDVSIPVGRATRYWTDECAIAASDAITQAAQTTTDLLRPEPTCVWRMRKQSSMRLAR